MYADSHEACISGIAKSTVGIRYRYMCVLYANAVAQLVSFITHVTRRYRSARGDFADEDNSSAL